jgi:hypothetical protein
MPASKQSWDETGAAAHHSTIEKRWFNVPNYKTGAAHDELQAFSTR